MDRKGDWSVSPAYDLTFSSGPNGEHCSLVMGEGRNPTQDHLLKLASVGDISKTRALEIIDEVQATTVKWNLFADEAYVSRASAKLIKHTMLI